MATRDCSADLCFIDCLTPTTPRANSKSIAKARSHTAKRFWRKRCLSPGLLAIQPNGNSDPLGSIATPLTARIAYAINFRKTQYVPACPFSRTPLSAVHRQDTRTTVIRKELSELNKPNSAKAFILHLVSMYARISNNDVEWRQEILRLRVDSVNIVRKAIEHGIHQDVTNAIHWLFADAVLAANLREALLHGEALRELLMSAKDVDQSTLINALCLDSQVSPILIKPVPEGLKLSKHNFWIFERTIILVLSKVLKERLRYLKFSYLPHRSTLLASRESYKPTLMSRFG
jgi:hypothetical protein